MKKWHLHEHVYDILDWWDDVNADSFQYPSAQQEQQLRFLAYERWLNDRELLTIEDEYVWQWTRPAHDPEKSPAPGRPTHTNIFTRTRVET